MKYNEETRLATADDGKVLVISDGIYVKTLFLSVGVTIDSVIEIPENEMMIEEEEILTP
jgi:hypothetical protein